MAAKKLRVRVVSKAKNSILARLAEEQGGIKQAADLIGVCARTYSAWLNFKSTISTNPSTMRKKVGLYTKVIPALEKHTGHSIEEIFPLSKKELAPIADKRIAEHDVETERLLEYAQKIRIPQSYTYDDEAIERQELLKSELKKALSVLTHRQKTIITLRYGLEGGVVYTLNETAKIMKVSPSRIRHIERQALQRLQRIAARSDLSSLADSQQTYPADFRIVLKSPFPAAVDL